MVVPLTPRASHPIIGAIRRILEDTRLPPDGMFVLRGGYEALLRLTPKVLKRALRLLNALLCALVDRGHATFFEPPKEPRGIYRLGVRQGRDEIQVSLRERLNQVPHQLTPEELQRQRRGLSTWAPRFDQSPSGRLELRLHGAWRTLSRGRFADGREQRLENMLGDVLMVVEDGLCRAAEKRREEQLQAEAVKLRALAQERERARQVYQAALVDNLNEMAEQWTKAGQVRSFLAALEARLSQEPRSAAFEAWLAWAHSHATELDPMSHPELIAKDLEPPSG